MGLKIKIIAFIIGIIFSLIVIRNLKRNNMNPPQTVLWLSISLFLVSIPVFEFFYQWIAKTIIGIADSRHIIYIFLIGFLLIYIFFLTIKLKHIQDQVKFLISFTAIIENKIDKTNEK